MPPIDLGDHLPEIAALVVLIAASAFFSGSEAALISLSRLRARGMRERGIRGSEAVLRLLEDRNRFIRRWDIFGTFKDPFFPEALLLLGETMFYLPR